MSSAKTVARPKGHHATNTKSRLRQFIAVPEGLYQEEESKVYTVICIAFVGVSLIGLGAGLIIYAQGVAIRDLVVIGAIGIFVGFVSLIVALMYLVQPILARRHRNRIAAMTDKQRYYTRNISVVHPKNQGSANGYINNYNNISMGDVSLHYSQPSNAQLYDANDEASKFSDVGHTPLTISVPSMNEKTPTYNVAFNNEETEESAL
ncbi:hypothetical protein SNE40_020190 [Patella caerulea]|uniref:Uncharacterized protein n=1 Tax=Patella caerulea TaxID=87958 RepID=A0AAN8J152_PATCE